MGQTNSTFLSTGGEKIFYRNWSASTKSKAVIILVHGLNSHSGYFQPFAEHLTQQGFEVYAIDHVGRGNSEGERYYIPDYQAVLVDIDHLVEIAREAHPSLPLFMLGHSAGGIFASVYAVKFQSKLKGLISESFAFQIPAPDFALVVLKFLAKFIPHTRVIQLKNEDFSRDKTVVAAMNSDPLIEAEKQPTKTMQQLILAAEYLKKELPAITIPILILHGTQDHATKPQGSKYYYKNVGSQDKSLKLYEGHYHDLLNDVDKEKVMKEVLEWLEQRI